MEDAAVTKHKVHLNVSLYQFILMWKRVDIPFNHCRVEQCSFTFVLPF